jgi:CRP/FNR family cyclic AMP-dependent transcriptional regulator
VGKIINGIVYSGWFKILIMKIDILVADPLYAFFRNGRLKEFKRSEVVSCVSRGTKNVYFIKRGFVKSYTINSSGHKNLLTISGAGDIFPLNEAFDEQELEIFYETMTPSVLYEMSAKKFQQALLADSSLAYTTLQKTAAVLNKYSERLENLEIADARAKIIYRLLFLSNLYGESNRHNEIEIQAPVNYQDLADSLNMARETANREIKKLEGQGLVKKKRNYLILLDKKKLALQLGS